MRDPDDLFTALSKSGFRSRFKLNNTDLAYLHRHGLDAILEHGKRFIADRLAPAEPINDGKQTPMRGHPIFVAQHATATCCRSCLAKWHHIPQGRELTDEEQQYVLSTLSCWLSKAIPPSGPSDGQQRLF
jgi:hypothetical protein